MDNTVIYFLAVEDYLDGLMYFFHFFANRVLLDSF